jgi:hypothetical protein
LTLGCRVRSCGTLGTERQEQQRTQTLPNQQGHSTSTRPISPGRRGLTGENVQNEAKLGATGVYGQRGLSCGAWLGRGVKRAKRTQFAGGRPGTTSRGVRAKRTQSCPAPGNGRRLAGRAAPPESDCAKRTQFGPAGHGAPGRGVSSVEFQVSSQRKPELFLPTSHFKPQTPRGCQGRGKSGERQRVLLHSAREASQGIAFVPGFDKI